jgi:hypothetical protein
VVHPDLRENPPQWLAAAEAIRKEIKKRVRPLDRDDFERLAGRCSGVTIHGAAILGPNETETRRHRQDGTN